MNEVVVTDSGDGESSAAPLVCAIVEIADPAPALASHARLPAPPTVSVQLHWLDNRWVVLGLLLTTGPIGLPALWLSRKFSRGVKIAVTLLFLSITIALPLGLTWYWCDVAIAPLVDMFRAGRQR